MSIKEFEDVDCEDCGCYGTSGFICEECANKRVRKALAAKQAEVKKVIDEIRDMKLIQTGTVTASINLLIWTYKKDKKFKEEISLSEFVNWLEKRLLAKLEGEE